MFTEAVISKLMYAIMIIGGLLIIAGVAMILFTDLYISQGVQGVSIIAGTIGAGLLLLIPAKIFLAIILMKSESDTSEN